MNLGCYNIRFSIRDYRGLKNLDNKVIVISAEKLKERKSYPSISSLTLFIVCFVSLCNQITIKIQMQGGEREPEPELSRTVQNCPEPPVALHLSSLCCMETQNKYMNELLTK